MDRSVYQHRCNGGDTFTLKTEQLLTPWRLAPGGKVWAAHPDGALLDQIVRDAGAAPGIVILGQAAQAGQAFARHGKSGGKSVIFVFGAAGTESVRLGLAPEIAGSGHFHDLLSGRPVEFVRIGGRWEADVGLTRWRMAMLVEGNGKTACTV